MCELTVGRAGGLRLGLRRRHVAVLALAIAPGHLALRAEEAAVLAAAAVPSQSLTATFGAARAPHLCLVGRVLSARRLLALLEECNSDASSDRAGYDWVWRGHEWSAFGGAGADWAGDAAVLKNHLGIRDIQRRVRGPQPRRINEQASSQSRDGYVMTVGVRAGGHTCSTPQFLIRS